MCPDNHLKKVSLLESCKGLRAGAAPSTSHWSSVEQDASYPGGGGAGQHTSGSVQPAPWYQSPQVRGDIYFTSDVQLKLLQDHFVLEVGVFSKGECDPVEGLGIPEFLHLSGPRQRQGTVGLGGCTEQVYVLAWMGSHPSFPSRGPPHTLLPGLSPRFTSKLHK